MTEILAVHSPENEVALLFRITNVAEGGTVARKVLTGQEAGLREYANWTIIRSLGYYGCMGLQLHHIEDLAVTEEKHDTSLHHVLEDEVFVVVANLIDVAHHEIIQSRLPPGCKLVGLRIVINLFLSDLGV